MVSYGGADLLVRLNNCSNLKKKHTGEEAGPLYLLVKEAGGAMFDGKGDDLGPKKVGLAEGRAFNTIITTSTESIGKEFIRKALTDPEIRKHLGN